MSRGTGRWIVDRPRGAVDVVMPAALAVLLGGTAMAVAWTSVYRPSEEWAIWALMATTLGAASGAAIPYGLRRWRDLGRLGAVSARATVPQLAAVFATACAFGAAYTAVRWPGARSEWRGSVLILIAGLGALPTLGATVGVGHAARALAGVEPAAQLVTLLRLRRLLQGLLATLSGVVALLVAAAATATAMTARTQPLVTLFFGGFMSVLVAIAYTPAAAALRRRGLSLVEACLPARDQAGDDLADLLEKRTRMEAAVGVDRTLFSDLQTNLTVISPLIASAGALLLQR